MTTVQLTAAILLVGNCSVIMLTGKLSVSVCVISIEYILVKKHANRLTEHFALAFSHLLLKNMYFIIKEMFLILKLKILLYRVLKWVYIESSVCMMQEKNTKVQSVLVEQISNRFAFHAYTIKLFVTGGVSTKACT